MPSPEKISGYQLAEHLLSEGGVEALLRYAGNAETDGLELKAGMCLLPEDRKKGKITVYIEAREPYSKEENFVFLRDACRFSLARDFPARAEKISLEIRKMRKGSPYNAYPDLVANTCFARLESVAQRLAKSTAKADKYYHHLLLRYILSGRADDRLRAAYCACASDWKVEYGHPWEMIEFYRAMLCDDKEQRVTHLKRALDLAAGGDLTLQVIATVILGTLLKEDVTDPAVYAEKVDPVIAQLPTLGAGRIAALREQTTNPQSGLRLAAMVLPFNFR